MKRFLFLLLLLLVAILGLGLWLTRPQPVDPGLLSGLDGDPDAGRTVFLAAGCAACHAAPGAAPADAPILAGGRRLPTRFGSFVAPNISPDPEHGIGRYSLSDFAGVLLHGVTPDGRHLYPVMPYTTYLRMKPQDVADLKAYLDELPPDATPDGRHDIDFPWSIRRLLGFWQEAYLDPSFVGAAPSPQLERGRYLVEALGHCAECHTPRDRFGGLDRSRWMAGAENPLGSGRVPNITPAALNWSQDEIVWYLESGFSPGHDQASGNMEAVVAALAQLPREDRAAIAAYLAGLAPIE